MQESDRFKANYAKIQSLLLRTCDLKTLSPYTQMTFLRIARG